MATLEPEHQATQEVEEAQGLHRKRGGVQKAPVAPGAVFKALLIEEWEYLGDLKEGKPQIPDRPRTPPTPDRSEEHLKQSWQRLTLDFAPGHVEPEQVALLNRTNFNYTPETFEQPHEQTLLAREPAEREHSRALRGPASRSW